MIDSNKSCINIKEDKKEELWLWAGSVSLTTQRRAFSEVVKSLKARQEVAEKRWLKRWVTAFSRTLLRQKERQ